MIDAKRFKDEIIDLLNTLYDSQSDNIEASAKLIADCIEKDGVVHVFGSGHSVGLGIDIKDRQGSLVPIHIMDMSHFVTKGGVPVEEFMDKKNIFERKPGVAGKLYELYDIKPQDVFIVISNSGINGIVIDIADLAKKNGHKVIIITSMKHTLAEEPRHPSGKKLYEFGDIVIDNCGPHGDALLETTGVAKVCSVSSICNNCIAQSMAARVIEILQEDGYELPVLNGDEAHDKALREKYEGRA
ncbi:MAG: SIS domain-containing protein [Erysipelotrichaceae bacterium]|nr:SIS domain-containing protein [Erysipelotrichaceae bacterium]MBQ5443797.1 SIS domain-containing protein [Erysipelotrichaceae bacterium]MBQ6215869.1 SIS domain-containing protein [Erysipelotrichaceae bacterium]MBR6232255.1 SIS domain-containing protein [Erysipelotrichaceae bacterium]